MPLLDPSQIAAFRAAIGLVTDQFFTTSIIYKKSKPAIDLYQEDQKDKEYTTYNFMGMVTPVISDRTEADIELAGTRGQNQIDVTVNMEALLALGDNLIDATTLEPHMDPTTDYLYLEDDGSIPYKVERITKHGPIDRQDVLVKIRARREPEKTARVVA